MASHGHAREDEPFEDGDGSDSASGTTPVHTVSPALRNRSRWVDSFTLTGRPSLSFKRTMRQEKELHLIEMARATRRVELAELDRARVRVRISILLIWLAFLGAVVGDIIGTIALCTQLTLMPTAARLVVGLGSGFALPTGAAVLTSRWARGRWPQRDN